LRKHEIYDNTYYIPNTKVRILETPISSSIMFQMLLYYHFFYDIFYLCVIFTTLIYKLWILKPVIIDVLAIIIGVIVWFPVELARLNYGYKGNINETVSINHLSSFIVPRTDSLHNFHNFLHRAFQHRSGNLASLVPA
jgi:Predicted membrane protein